MTRGFTVEPFSELSHSDATTVKVFSRAVVLSF